MDDYQILQNAYNVEHDSRRPKWRDWAYQAVGATKKEVKRLEDEGFLVISRRFDGLTKYLLSDKGNQVVKEWSEATEIEPVPEIEVMEALELIVGFEDIKQTLAETIAKRRRVNFLLEGPPACAKSVILDGVRQAVPYAYQAFGSRTSASGLSEVLFTQRPGVLLLDEADKMRHDVYSVLLGLMEGGEVLETKTGKTRGIRLNTIVIAACNSSKKMTAEFLSRFAFHAHFPEYTREEFLEVVISMLHRSEGCEYEIAKMIGIQVYDSQIGDVRKARAIWQLMREPTEEEVRRVIKMNLKYGPQNTGRKSGRRPLFPRLPGI